MSRHRDEAYREAAKALADQMRTNGERRIYVPRDGNVMHPADPGHVWVQVFLIVRDEDVKGGEDGSSGEGADIGPGDIAPGGGSAE